MEIELLTKGDLQAFRLQLLEDLKGLLKPTTTTKRWLRSSEVKKLLHIAPSTLQKLRIKGVLHPTKVGGSYYYDHDELESVLSKKQA